MPDPVVVDPQVTPPATLPAASDPPKPTHPLEPGGERFSEVYRDMQEARRENARMSGELEALKATQRQTAQQQQQPRFYTAIELQGLVDAGKILPAVMADQLAWQRAQQATAEAEQRRVVNERTSSARSEVETYLEKIPTLNKAESPEFQKVRRAAADIAKELDRDINDPIVQRRALREVFGTLDRVTAASGAIDYSRQRADIHAETGAGGGSAERERQGSDPLKNVSRAYKEHWDRLGYSQEQRLEEAKYVKREPRPGQR